jgi:periplasmic protein CpxP/Spy
MKKMFLTSLLLLSVFTISFSQTQPQQMKTPEERAEHQTKRWTKELSLTPDQASKTKAVFLDRDTKIEALKSKHASSADKKAMHAEEKTIREQADASLKGIFTPEQYATYTSKKEHPMGKSQGHTK